MCESLWNARSAAWHRAHAHRRCGRAGDRPLHGNLEREIGNRRAQALFQRHPRLPTEHIDRALDHRLASPGIVLRQRPVLDFGTGASLTQYQAGDRLHRDFVGVAEIARPRHVLRALHQEFEALQKIVDVAERSRLRTIAVDRQRLFLERLDDEVRDNAAVVLEHARPIGIEDARDLDRQLVDAMIVEEQRLGAALALVVARANADRIDVPDVAFRLRMDLGIAVHFAGRCLKNASALFRRKFQKILGADHAGLQRAYRIALIMSRRGRACEIVDTVYRAAEGERLADVMLDEREARMIQKRLDVLEIAGVEIVDADHAMPLLDQAIAQVRSDETGAPGNQYVLPRRGHRPFSLLRAPVLPDSGA
jgi:hypothetical protein